MRLVGLPEPEREVGPELGELRDLGTRYVREPGRGVQRVPEEDEGVAGRRPGDGARRRGPAPLPGVRPPVRLRVVEGEQRHDRIHIVGAGPERVGQRTVQLTASPVAEAFVRRHADEVVTEPELPVPHLDEVGQRYPGLRVEQVGRGAGVRQQRQIDGRAADGRVAAAVAAAPAASASIWAPITCSTVSGRSPSPATATSSRRNSGLPCRGRPSTRRPGP